MLAIRVILQLDGRDINLMNPRGVCGGVDQYPLSRVRHHRSPLWLFLHLGVCVCVCARARVCSMGWGLWSMPLSDRKAGWTHLMPALHWF